jgi:hypothetical protein
VLRGCMVDAKWASLALDVNQLPPTFLQSVSVSAPSGMARRAQRHRHASRLHPAHSKVRNMMFVQCNGRLPSIGIFRVRRYTYQSMDFPEHSGLSAMFESK